MASYGKGFFLCAVLQIVRTSCNLQTLVETVASYDNASGTIGTELCIFTTRNSTLDAAAPNLLQHLVESYPTIFLIPNALIDPRSYRLATMVLLDVTAFEDKFPMRFLTLLLYNHPCYRKSAKFVILMARSAFGDRANIAALMERRGILNFIAIRLDPADGGGGPLTVWTKNQFTKREHHFGTNDGRRRPVSRLFPNKLANLHGYRFVLYSITEFPYVIGFIGDTTYGVLVNFFNIIFRQRLNGTTGFTEKSRDAPFADGVFNTIDERHVFHNALYFREPTGIHLVCPVHQERDFLQHLLKPFSLGIWLVLGGLYVGCQMLQVLLPTVYRYDLIGITFFGGGGVEYEQPFPFRAVAFALTVLVFFLSEAYNTKIISLMSLAKFLVQPHTLAGVARSDFRVLSSPYLPDHVYEHDLKFLSNAQSRREERRLGTGVNELYCTMMSLGVARVLTTTRLSDYTVLLYTVQEPLFAGRSVLQLHQDSPFFELVEDYYNRFNDVGVWQRTFNLHMAILSLSSTRFDSNEPFHEVVFFFDDLACVWMLIVAGWLISGVAFAGELAWFKLERKVRTRKGQEDYSGNDGAILTVHRRSN